MDIEFFGGTMGSLVIALVWIILLGAFGGIFIRALAEVRAKRDP